METLIDIVIKAIPLTIAIAIGGGLACFVVLSRIGEYAKLRGEEEQRIRDLQDADRDALVATLEKQNDVKQKMIDDLLKTNAYLHKRLSVMPNFTVDPDEDESTLPSTP